MSGTNQTREEEYRDCPFELWGRDALKEQKGDIKEVSIHLQGMEVSRAEDTQKLEGVVLAVVRIEAAVEDVKRLVREVQTTEPPVDTFRVVIFDLGLWVLKLGTVGGLVYYILNNISI